MIKSAADLISEENPNYQYVAGRLINYHLRKEVYGSYNIPSLGSHIDSVIKMGYYDPNILNWYSPEDINTLNTYINHDRDYQIAYVGMEQFRGKYLIKNRTNGKIFETPQMAYILIAMVLFRNYDKGIRLKWVKDLYDSISNFEISLPTPIMAGLRSPQKQFSSCVLVDSDDSLDSIIATTGAVVKYVSQKAGIGINAGRIRAGGSPIRNGDTSHTGVVPFFKLFQAAVKSCSQGGVRGGASTLYYPIWHLEVEDLLVLKNNKGTEDNRVRHLDYGVQFNKVMYERLLTGGNITLFSPSDVPELYESFFKDADKFREIYEKAERNPKIRKKVISAIELFSNFMQERKDTGRIYLMNVDHANDHGAFDKEKAVIYQSNLCCVSGETYVTVEMTDGSIQDIMIKDATIDMKVLSRNNNTGKDEFRQVKAAAMTRKNASLMKITDDNGNSIVCTPDHRIYTKNRGYVEAQNILETDELLVS